MQKRGFFGIGVFHAKTKENIGTLLRSAQAFGAAFVFTVGRRYSDQSSDTTKAPRHLPVFHALDINELRRGLPMNCRIVGVENLPEARELPSYVHPAQALYLLGAEDSGLSAEALSVCHDIVQIPQPKFCLNVATAGSIVLYDRVSKDVTWQ